EKDVGGEDIPPEKVESETKTITEGGNTVTGTEFSRQLDFTALSSSTSTSSTTPTTSSTTPVDILPKPHPHPQQQHQNQIPQPKGPSIQPPPQTPLPVTHAKPSPSSHADPPAKSLSSSPFVVPPPFVARPTLLPVYCECFASGIYCDDATAQIVLTMLRMRPLGKRPWKLL
ncbi:hypothetical protein MKW98_011893, partial [Papaver atlanticum]